MTIGIREVAVLVAVDRARELKFVALLKVARAPVQLSQAAYRDLQMSRTVDLLSAPRWNSALGNRYAPRRQAAFVTPIDSHYHTIN
ncbi:MAG: hypothetical protein ACI8W7_003644 [Gammaproteobacteria bacterium]|jgi:hypothetical protein